MFKGFNLWSEIFLPDDVSLGQTLKNHAMTLMNVQYML